MKVIHRNTELPIELLKPHPDNPRKDVGDISELAESIKANGIFQNLTVLKGDALDGYTVLIGHRRLAAAKLAGLELVPCMVVDMDKREQVSTMLLENMQRNDLTVYEQAQGFQMMLDLGDTEDGICEKTGFSKTTVRHRLKLLELDPEEFKKSQEKGVTLDDYILLEKIKDPELKNKALKDIGSANFNWKVESAVREEKDKKNIEAWNKWLSGRLEKVEYKYGEREALSRSYSIKRTLTNEVKEEIEKLIEIQKETCPNKPEAYYMQDNYGFIYIVGRKKEVKQKAEQELYRKRKERIEPIEEQAQKLRREFVKSYNGGQRELAFLVPRFLLCPEALNGWNDIYEELAERFGIEYYDEDEEYSSAEKFVDSKKFIELSAKKPAKVLLTMLDIIYDCHTDVHDYFGNFVGNDSLKRYYQILKELGYQISDDERALLDGTHECFKEAE